MARHACSISSGVDGWRTVRVGVLVRQFGQKCRGLMLREVTREAVPCGVERSRDVLVETLRVLIDGRVDTVGDGPAD